MFPRTRLRTTAAILAITTVAMTLASQSASAQYLRTACQNGQCPAPVAPQAVRYYQPVRYVQAAPVYATQAATHVGSDPASFLAWLNATRARHGLGAVGYDPDLANDAAINNSHQNARGLGHFFMGRARRQNAAMGGHDLGNRWMNSPSHRAALLDPSIRAIGLAGSGAYWTFSAN